MIDADQFLEPARDRGFDFYTGVPCSFLTPFINRAIEHPRLRYVGAASEGEAVAIAAGAWLAGRKTVALCQNSGLGNAVNPLTSLNFPFRIPTLLVTTWRGQPGIKDEPQHELMGQVTQALLDTIRIKHLGFPKTEAAVIPALDAAESSMITDGLPFALVMEKGTVGEAAAAPAGLQSSPRGELFDYRRHRTPPSRIDILMETQRLTPGSAAVIATTGKCGRELFTLGDRPQQLYQVGSMGCTSAMALGIALNTQRTVIALDGDGAALMKMGNLATIGAYRPRNLVHVILDNGVHDSTGGQTTVSPSVDFAMAAIACGYARAVSIDDVSGFTKAFEEALTVPGPQLIHARIAPGSLETLGRPTISPAQVALRLRAFLQSGPSGTA